mmetsp:Transcript_9405/g.14178  ORF Transcript_9405/g.14178 Transcript_9405/m.14178 type:complete len:142 (+) Transcript_9405:156-581(+)
MHTSRRFYSSLPEVMVGHEPITRQDTSFLQLFSFVNWQGVGLVRYLYWIGMWVIGLFNLVLLIGGLSSGQPGAIIAVLVFVPIFSAAELIVLRIICEVSVVLLLLPYYFKKSESKSSAVAVIGNPNNDGDMDVSLHDSNMA